MVRCAAISCVLVSHSLFLITPHPGLSKVHVWWGTLGVELFFVLSGFLIGSLLLQELAGSARFGGLGLFWIRRWLRTLPNYYLFLALNISLFIFMNGQIPAFGRHVFFTQNLLSWEGGPLFNPSWSLAIEEWFYLILPLMLFLLSKAMGNLKRAAILSVIVLSVTSLAARSVAAVLSNPSWDSGIRKVVLFRFDALMAGVLGAVLQRYYQRAWSASGPAGLMAGSLLLAIGSFLFFSLPLNHSYFAKTGLLSVFPLGILLLLPAMTDWREGNGMGAAVVRKASVWSYSLYLCHPLLVSIGLWMVGSLGERNLAFRLGFVAVTLLGSILTAALLYTYFEKPLLQLRDSLGRSVRLARA